MSAELEKFSIPGPDDYNQFYHRYISLAPTENFMQVFGDQVEMLQKLLGNLPEGVDQQLHAPYTWNLKQVVGHLIDCERIFSTRLLRIGVGDPAILPGMDQDVYVANLDYDQVSMSDLLDEFSGLRKSNVLLANRMSAECLQRRGIASDSPVSAKANLFILVGHVEYHAAIIRKRLSGAA